MLFHHKHDDKSFLGVALATILVGAAIFSFGMVCWLVNVSQSSTLFAIPSLKILGGLVVMSLGYIQLELDLIRRK